MAVDLVLGECGTFDKVSNTWYLDCGYDSDPCDFIVDLAALDPATSASLEINIINCSSISLKGATGTLKQLTVRAPDKIKYTGGANVENLSVFSPENDIDTSRVTTLDAHNYSSPDIEYVRGNLKGICLTPGSGDALSRTELERSFAELKESLPSLEWVCPVVSWYCTSKDTSTAKLQHLEFDIASSPISGQSFGRSYTDEEVLKLYQTSKEQGYKTLFAPSILVDDPGTSWRGDITGDPDSALAFFHEQYKPMILKYAGLLRGNVDSFLIGSEMKGLISIQNEAGDFVIVDALITLAGEVRKILGDGVQISYGANWDTYHHVDGGERPLDKLWASPPIDFVSISFYPPQNNGSVKCPTSGLIASKFAHEGGEWGYNDLLHLHKNEHWSGTKTEWKPRMKPVWLTEFGFAVTQGTSNSPNVFAPNMPSYSTGHLSWREQMAGLAGALKYQESVHGDDTISETDGGGGGGGATGAAEEAKIEDSGSASLSFLSKMFAWNWDLRGKDWHKDHYWSDALKWRAGHNLEGKLGSKEKARLTHSGGSPVILGDYIIVIS